MRTLRFFTYFFARALVSFFEMGKAERATAATVEETDRLKLSLPKHWSSRLLQIAGAEVDVTGTEHLPKGAVVIIANHVGNFDIPVLLAHVPKPFGFISKIEVLKIPIIGRWMKIMNCVFMDRSNRQQSMKAISDGVDLLKAGHSLVIFPEGTRSKGGPLQPFKVGSFKLAIDAGVPIVPIAISGTADLMEKHDNKITPGRVKLTILPAVTAEEVAAMDRKTLAAHVQAQIEAHI